MNESLTKLRALIGREMGRDCSCPDMCSYCLKVNAALAAVEQETAELQSDHERIEWLSSNGHPLEVRNGTDRVGFHYGLVLAPEVPLREGIDRLRAADAEAYPYDPR